MTTLNAVAYLPEKQLWVRRLQAAMSPDYRMAALLGFPLANSGAAHS
ncbi:hypothetical protein [Mesoterricola sediminis]|nr:hypothetical protein [Mesoterricola sediminis]